MTLNPISSSRPWTRSDARHLLNRAGFGVPVAAVERLAALRPEQAVAALVDYDKYPDPLASPESWLPPVANLGEFRQQVQQLSESERRMLRQDRQREEREVMRKLQMWWVDRMVRSPRPLEEKLTLFWHGHFATSAEKVREPRLNYLLNQSLRRYASGNFRNLLTAVAQSPCMLRYLDNQQNIKAKPNENWARELLELFTLGIGNYSEQDIKEAARAFTGWTHRGEQFIFNARQHDDGEKTFLTRRGTFDGYDIITLILHQPACSRHIVTKLWKFFAYDDPEPQIIAGLAETLVRSNYELKPVLRQIFMSEAFYSDKARTSQVKSPAQLTVNLLSQLNVELGETPPIAPLAMRAMGQSLFYPPNVKGWDGGRAWINTNTLLLRYNFANFLVAGVIPDFGGQGGRISRQQMENMARENADANDSMMSGGTMTNGENRNRDNAPVGQDAMPNDIPGSTFYQAVRNRARAADPNALAPFRITDFFARFQGMTGDDLVSNICDHFFGFQLDGDQRQKLGAILARGNPPNEPYNVSRSSETDLRAAIQLLLSTAEYQLC